MVLPEISINVGDGLTLEDNVLTVNASLDDNLQKKNDGLYVTPSPNSPSTGLWTIDNWTVVPYDTNKTIKTNRDVIQYIFTMCKYKITERSTTSLKTSNTAIKTKTDVLAELNWINTKTNTDHSAYRPIVGDIISFSSFANPMNMNNKSWGAIPTCEDLNRYPTNSDCCALFVIDDIQYTNNETKQMPITDIILTCFWTDGSIGTAGSILT